LNTNNK